METIAISPAIVSRDTKFYGPAASSFYPEQYISQAPEIQAGHARRYEFMQWGGGVHACKGEKLARMFVFDELWGRFLKEGYEFEAISGVKIHPEVLSGVEDDILSTGRRNVDDVASGVKPTWAEENLGNKYCPLPVVTKRLLMYVYTCRDARFKNSSQSKS